jgi:putative MATE family efflux protein
LLRSHKIALFLSFRELTRPNLQTFKRLFKAGLPTTIEQLAWAFGMLVMTSYVAVLGVTLLAAHQVFMRIQAILSMLYMGFGMGAMTLMGKNLGADNRRLAQHTAETSSWVMSACVLVIVIVLVVFSRQVISIFTADPEVIHIGIFVMRVFALAQIPKALDGVLMGNLRGAGDIRWLMWLTIASVVFIEIGFNWLVAFVFKWSLLGLWIVHLIDETLRLVASYLRFKGGKWKFFHV